MSALPAATGGLLTLFDELRTEIDDIVLRGLMSARTSPRAWDLRREVREKMTAWLQETHPQALPRLRAELERTPEQERASRAAGDGAGEPPPAPDRLRQPRDTYE